MVIRGLEFYSGIGGLHYALDRSTVDGSIVCAFDWDQTAASVYRANHGEIVQKLDISTLTASSLAGYEANLWLMSPACQPYTVLNQQAKGAADPRAKSFLHLITSVLPELAATHSHPDYLLVENVAGFEASTTRQNLVSTLTSLGYTVCELLLTPLQFGTPNSRLRYYLLAKLRPLTFALPNNADHIWRHIPGRGKDWMDPRSDTSLDLNHVKEIRSYLDPEDQCQSLPYAIPDRVLKKWGRLFDIVLPSSRRTCCFTRGYTQLVERSGSILQMNERLDTTTTFNQFLAQCQCQDSSEPDPVHILHPLRLRYFSPTELLRLFSFEDPHTADLPLSSSQRSFTWPDGISTKTKYRLIGNSVNVEVVTKLINFLFEDTTQR